MYGMMVSLVEFFNFSSAIIVVFVFFVMVIYIIIYRFHINDPVIGFDMPNRMPVCQTAVDKVFIPFIFKLHDPGKSSLQEVSFEVSSSIPWAISCFWGIEISEFYNKMSINWIQLHQLINQNDLYTGKFLTHLGPLVKEPCEEEIVTVSPPVEVTAEQLGNSPRSCYPLIVVMMEQNPLKNPVGNEVVALFNVVHIKDDLSKMESSTLYQYLKQANGQITSLKQLYIEPASDNNEEEGDSASTESRSNEDYDSVTCDSNTLCVVCRTRMVSRALLPCRHACVCQFCFKKLEKCPMCRSIIQFFFLIRNEEPINYAEEQGAMQGTSVNMSLGQRLAHWNTRLNHWLGFR